jgi:hypothetical protein
MEIEKGGIIYVSAPEIRPDHCSGCVFDYGSGNTKNCIGITRCTQENRNQIFVVKSPEKTYTITEIKRILLVDDWNSVTVNMIGDSIVADSEYAEFLRLSEKFKKESK